MVKGKKGQWLDLNCGPLVFVETSAMTNADEPTLCIQTKNQNCIKLPWGKGIFYTYQILVFYRIIKSIKFLKRSLIGQIFLTQTGKKRGIYWFCWTLLSPKFDFTFTNCRVEWLLKKYGSSPDSKEACHPILAHLQ